MLPTPVISIIIWKWTIYYASLSPIFITQQSKMNQKLYEKHLCNQSTHYNSINVAVKGVAPINYRLKSEVSITLLCQLFSTHYTAIWIKTQLKSTSVIKVAIGGFPLRTQKKPSRTTTKLTLLLSAKMNGTQRRTLLSPWRMHCTYCSMPKGTSQAEAMSNSEKIKLIVLAVIELCLSEGIS